MYSKIAAKSQSYQHVEKFDSKIKGKADPVHENISLVYNAPLLYFSDHCLACKNKKNVSVYDFNHQGAESNRKAKLNVQCYINAISLCEAL